MGTNQTYKNRALESLEGHWTTAAVATLILLIITSGISYAAKWTINDVTIELSTGGIWSILCMPLDWGFAVFFLNLIRKEDIDYGRLFDGYRDFIRIVVAMFLMMTAFIIGSVLLIIPGLIIGTGLSMTSYILKDNPEMGAVDAMKKSWQMTQGHKMRLFWLTLSFTGWFILSIMTFGLGLLLLSPYMGTTYAHYYEDLKAGQIA